MITNYLKGYTMKFSTTIFIDKKEMKAYGKQQKALEKSVVSIMNAFGKDISLRDISKPTQLEMLKMAFGKELIRSGNSESNGIRVEWIATLTKKGVTVTVTIDMDPEITIEITEAYADIVNIYIPVLASTITGMVSANALSEQRLKKANRAIRKL